MFHMWDMPVGMGWGSKPVEAETLEIRPQRLEGLLAAKGELESIRKEVIEMKIVNLCGKGHCPVVKIADEHVKIGEKDNVCVLTKSEWEALKQKILNREI